MIMERVDFAPSSFGTVRVSSVSRPTGEWKDADCDVVNDGVGRPDIDYGGSEF